LDRHVQLIDSIDEIHPESAKSLLQRVDEYVKRRRDEDEKVPREKRGFLRVFILGRPEGFTDYYRITQGGVFKTKPVALRGPCFRNDEDRRAAARSVVPYVLGVGEKHPPCRIDTLARKAVELGNSREWLKESFQNLTAFNDLVRAADSGEAPHEGPDNDFALKEMFFQSLLGRARASHHRPEAHTREYLGLLETIARRYNPGPGTRH
jgi:hypothetical protein